MMTMPQIEHFSEGYYLLDTELTNYGGDHAAAPHDMMEQLSQVTSVPLFRAGDEHFYAKSEWGIPANTIAVPDEFSTDESVLLAKETTARSLVMRGEEPEPP
jgi:hypothetical protein